MKKYNQKKLLINIGEKLKTLRKEKGYTNHEDLANDLDMARSQYWEYENGKKNITIISLKKILDQLNVSLSDFFSDDFN